MSDTFMSNYENKFKSRISFILLHLSLQDYGYDGPSHFHLGVFFSCRHVDGNSREMVRVIILIDKIMSSINDGNSG